MVTSNGRPVAGAAATFTVTKPNSAVVTGTAATSATGAAVYKLKIVRRDPTGVYQIGARASSGGTTATGSTSFMAARTLEQLLDPPARGGGRAAREGVRDGRRRSSRVNKAGTHRHLIAG